MRQPVSPRMGLDAPCEALGPAPSHRQVAARADAQAACAFRTGMPPDNDGPVGVGLGLGLGLGLGMDLHVRLGASRGLGVDTAAHRQSSGNSGASARKASSAPSSTTCCVAPSVSPV